MEELFKGPVSSCIPRTCRLFGWPLFVAIFMTHENGDKQRQSKRRQVEGMLDETDPLSLCVDFRLL